MDNYYEIFDIEQSLSTDEIQVELDNRFEMYINIFNNNYDSERAQQAQISMDIISGAKKCFETEQSRKDYDKKLGVGSIKERSAIQPQVPLTPVQKAIPLAVREKTTDEKINAIRTANPSKSKTQSSYIKPTATSGLFGAPAAPHTYDTGTRPTLGKDNYSHRRNPSGIAPAKSSPRRAKNKNIIPLVVLWSIGIFYGIFLLLSNGVMTNFISEKGPNYSKYYVSDFIMQNSGATHVQAMDGKFGQATYSRDVDQDVYKSKYEDVKTTPFIYDDARGFGVFKSNGQWGIIDSLDFVYDEIIPIRPRNQEYNVNCILQKDGKYGLFSPNGESLDCIFTEIEFVNQHSYSYPKLYKASEPFSNSGTLILRGENIKDAIGGVDYWSSIDSFILRSDTQTYAYSNFNAVLCEEAVFVNGNLFIKEYGRTEWVVDRNSTRTNFTDYFAYPDGSVALDSGGFWNYLYNDSNTSYTEINKESYSFVAKYDSGWYSPLISNRFDNKFWLYPGMLKFNNGSEDLVQIGNYIDAYQGGSLGTYRADELQFDKTTGKMEGIVFPIKNEKVSRYYFSVNKFSSDEQIRISANKNLDFSYDEAAFAGTNGYGSYVILRKGNDISYVVYRGEDGYIWTDSQVPPVGESAEEFMWGEFIGEEKLYMKKDGRWHAIENQNLNPFWFEDYKPVGSWTKDVWLKQNGKWALSFDGFITDAIFDDMKIYESVPSLYSTSNEYNNDSSHYYVKVGDKWAQISKDKTAKERYTLETEYIYDDIILTEKEDSFVGIRSGISYYVNQDGVEFTPKPIKILGAH